jgi:hypothetical protein
LDRLKVVIGWVFQRLPFGHRAKLSSLVPMLRWEFPAEAPALLF